VILRLPQLAGPRSRLACRIGVTAALLILTTLFYYLLMDERGLFTNYFFFELRQSLHGCAYTLAILCAALTLPRSGFWTTWLVAFLVHLPRMVYFSLSTASLVQNMGFWFLPLLAGAIVALEIHWRSAQRQAEVQRARETEQYVQQLLAAQEGERRRISQDIHDTVLQDLLALACAPDRILSTGAGDADTMIETLRWMKENIIRVAHELRRISCDLRPSTIDHLGLVPSLRALAQSSASEVTIPIRVSVAGRPKRLTGEAEIALFRIVQEALANIRKHSQATDAWVNLAYTRDSVRLEVGDNGVGISSQLHMDQLASQGHLGLLGIRERVLSLGGHFRVVSRQDSGTVLRATVPILRPVSDQEDTAKAADPARQQRWLWLAGRSADVGSAPERGQDGTGCEREPEEARSGIHDRSGHRGARSWQAHRRAGHRV